MKSISAGMLISRRILLTVLAIAAVLVVVRIHTTSTDAQALKRDIAEIDDVRYGLLDADRWVEHLLVVIDGQIETLGDDPAQRDETQKVVEAVIVQLVNEVEQTIRRQNQQRAFSALRQRATNFVVDFDEMRNNAGAYAAVAVEELERPENKGRLKSFLRERITAYADSALEQTDRSAYVAILATRACGERLECRATMLASLAEQNETLAGLTVLAISLITVTFLLSAWPIHQLGAVELGALLIGVFALLVGGLSTPMIDIRAEIVQLDFTLVGESITFENQVLFFQSKSILDVVELLIRTTRVDLVLVGIGIGLFSVVFPVLKLLATVGYRFNQRWRTRALVRFFALESSKWSMADVFVIAMFLAFLGFDGLTGNQLAALMTDSPSTDLDTHNGTELRVGFHLFAAFCLSGLVLSGLVKRSASLNAD